MDINDVRGLGTVFAMIAFFGIIAWAYSSSRKNRFEEDGNIPFNEESKDSQPQKDSENDK
jgi:cytochrome c oxidase cbb3-type subunit 4